MKKNLDNNNSEDKNNVNLSIQNIYLKKQRFINNTPLVVLNFPSKAPIRQYFMHNILKISNEEWNKYYNKMHFKGIDPPHIVNSNESMLKYILTVKGAIGYIPYSLLEKNLKIILEFNNE